MSTHQSSPASPCEDTQFYIEAVSAGKGIQKIDDKISGQAPTGTVMSQGTLPDKTLLKMLSQH